MDGKVVSRDDTTGGSKIRFDLSRNRFEVVDGDPLTVRFADLAPGTKECEICLPDGLHPNARGYARIAERFLGAAFGDGAPFAEQDR